MSREIWSEIVNDVKNSNLTNEQLIEIFNTNFTISKKDFTIEARKKQFACIIGQMGKEYPREMLVEFYNYWTEISINGKKFRYEKEKVFDVKLRLQRWHKNSKNGKKHNISEAKSIADRILSGELS